MLYAFSNFVFDITLVLSYSRIKKVCKCSLAVCSLIFKNEFTVNTSELFGPFLYNNSNEQ